MFSPRPRPLILGKFPPRPKEDFTLIPIVAFPLPPSDILTNTGGVEQPIIYKVDHVLKILKTAQLETSASECLKQNNKLKPTFCFDYNRNINVSLIPQPLNLELTMC